MTAHGMRVYQRAWRLRRFSAVFLDTSKAWMQRAIAGILSETLIPYIISFHADKDIVMHARMLVKGL